MLTAQTIQNSLDELRMITRIDFALYEPEGRVVAATFDTAEVSSDILISFASSAADSQVLGHYYLLKISEDDTLQYILVARGLGEDAYTMGRVAVCQIRALMGAYKEKFDRNSFFQNLLLDNMLLVDIYNRAKKLHIEDAKSRAVFLVQTNGKEDGSVALIMRGMFSEHSGDYVTSVEENSVILVKEVEPKVNEEELDSIAYSIIDTISAEAMMDVHVAYGGVIHELKDVSKSYKEAKLAAEVGNIFYQEKHLIAYHNLGIGRLIYQLPVNLCHMFIREIFGGEDLPEELDEETLNTVDKFFENNLNVSETSRQLYVHRNTLVYRIEKLQKATGLDIRTFEDALTLKIALMVSNYMKYLERLEN